LRRDYRTEHVIEGKDRRHGKARKEIERGTSRLHSKENSLRKSCGPAVKETAE
jgi:hypothetical protein